MKENFAKIVPWIFEDEGEFSDDEGDPGGATRLGIIKADWAEYTGRTQSSITTSEMRKLTPAQCTECYRKLYWDRCNCDELPPGVDYFTFDCGLLNGVGTARKWVQRAVGVIPDGKIGPKTLAAISKDDPVAIISKMEALRRARCKSSPAWNIFKNGWTNRINKSKARAVKMVEGKL